MASMQKHRKVYISFFIAFMYWFSCFLMQFSSTGSSGQKNSRYGVITQYVRNHAN